ncbi:inner membrane protein [Schizosaccharomyces japonicus yFS275]|uniref:Inner membrane protein n=1 Tax=Schizosaccharomyces japonicus (strain yFS275 / FY16936) TaxID=402676 RepID=B6JWH9_SCHJY|nr:inner membrane protein [Schizosaccharomyces japonicus yFS275]EEB05730.2 inner membrane protein [Schizosaccharomyces japonicus yFS275]
MGRSCQYERKKLANCLLRSDCMLIQGRSAQDCLRHKDELPVECQECWRAFHECKRRMLDMSQRFRTVPTKPETLEEEEDLLKDV